MGVKAKEAQSIEDTLKLANEVIRALRPLIPTEWLNLDITMPQLKIMLVLFENGPTRMSLLASSLRVSMSTATEVVDHLVSRDLVFRESNPDDRRVVLCRLSDKGQQLMVRLWEVRRVQSKKLLEMMTSAQLQLVVKAFQAILKAATAVEQQRPDSPET